MDQAKFMREIRPNLRPIGIDTCPTCGKEKQMINKLLNSRAIARCIPCWQRFDEEDAYQPPSAPVKKVAVAQETLDELRGKVSELEGRVVGLEAQVNSLTNGRKRR